MKIIISESQRRILLRESTSEQLGGIIKKNFNNLKKIIIDAKEQMSLNLQFLLTWGAGIGGFIGVVQEFVKGEFPTLSDLELNQVLIGVIATYFIENKDFVTKIYKKIKKANLDKIFKSVLSKSDKLINTFLDFIQSLGVTFHKITNMMSYMFILPLIPLIFQMVDDGFTNSLDLKEFAMRIIGFAGVTISGLIFKELLIKMVERFKR